MYKNLTVGAVIPAHDEEENIGAVVSSLLQLRTVKGSPIIDDLVVCDNASTDRTARLAQRAGARVAHEPIPGYGRACLTALEALQPVDAILFVDGDQAFDTAQSRDLLDAIAAGADLVIGSRALGRMEPGALSVPQIAGNRLASLLIRLLWRVRVSDLGPFRAVRSEALQNLDMCDTAYGWTVEMQVKAIQSRIRMIEIPVDTRRRRFGKSKVGGTVRGVIGAGVGILTMIFRLWIRGPAPISTAPHPRGRKEEST
jgi:glycosyltransferase involved in cell wall biosynthesis